VKKPKATNPELTELSRYLRKQSTENNAKIWKTIATLLTKTKRNRVAVNLSRLNRNTQKNEVAVVPGKVLSAGEIDHPLTITAFAFSQKAREKILAAHGKCLSFTDLIKKNPKGSNVKIIR
jgi:large subunit ribosomal protein L18e